MIKNDKFAAIVMWFARVVGVLILALFLVFGIGEGFSGMGNWLPLNEYVMLLFIPIMTVAGIIIAWRRPILGGYLIIGSVVLFNLIDVIVFSGNQFLNLDFGWLVVLGLLFVVSSHAHMKKNK